MPLYVWTKLSSSPQEEDWEERLGFHEGLVITQLPGKKTLKLEVYSGDQQGLENLRASFGGVISEVIEQNWVAMSVPAPILVKVRDRIVVTSEREPNTLANLRSQFPKRHLISIPAELAFGTGDHATTATCLRTLVDWVEERRRNNQGRWNALDLGTGSGVLAIAAKMLGASSVEGCDFDPLALEVAKRNVVENGFTETDIPMLNRDVLKWKPKRGQWDLIMANLFCDVLQAIFEKLHHALAPGGRVLVSGILATQAPKTLATARDAGFTEERVLKRGKWVTALLR